MRIIGMNTFVNRAGFNGRTVSVKLLLKRTKRESHEDVNERKEYPRINSRDVYFLIISRSNISPKTQIVNYLLVFSRK